MPTNERLRGSIATAGLRPADLAQSVGVDTKTVERWITKGRMPHRAHRVDVARVLNVAEEYVWPALLTEPATRSASVAELLELHPSRSSVPHSTWQQLFANTHEAMDILVYAGTFLFEQLDILTAIRMKAHEGVRVRMLMGDETSAAVRQRAEEEGTAGGLQGRVQLQRRYLREVAGIPGVEIREHGTTLYNSLYRFDQDLLVNCHAFGAPAGHSPVLHLRRVPGGRIWDHYMRSFEEVWKVGSTTG